MSKDQTLKLLFSQLQLSLLNDADLFGFFSVIVNL